MWVCKTNLDDKMHVFEQISFVDRWNYKKNYQIRKQKIYELSLLSLLQRTKSMLFSIDGVMIVNVSTASNSITGFSHKNIYLTIGEFFRYSILA